MTLVSIIIPYFNSGATIEKTIASAKTQSWSPLEIIVINDGSTDAKSCSILRKLKGVKVINQENAGLPSARNTGFKHANGEYVLPLDADDWIETDAIEQLMKPLRENSRICFSFSPIILENEASGILTKPYNYFEQLFFNQLPYSLLLPKHVWQQIGGYNTEMKDGYEDWEFNVRLGRLGFFGEAIPKPVFHYKVSQSGMLLSKASKLHFTLWADIQARNLDVYSFRSLMSNWRKWRRHKSTYPLFVYFLWLFMSRIFPENIMVKLFTFMLNFSHSRRVTAATQKKAM